MCQEVLRVKVRVRIKVREHLLNWTWSVVKPDLENHPFPLRWNLKTSQDVHLDLRVLDVNRVTRTEQGCYGDCRHGGSHVEATH